MLITKYRDHFLMLHSDNCDAEQLFKNYQHYYFKYQDGNCHPIEEFSDCLWYLKKLVARNTPVQTVGLLFSKGNDITPLDIRFQYIDLVCLVARIEEYVGQYDHAVYWSKKVLDYMGLFHLSKDGISKEFLSNLYSHYSTCFEIFQKYENYFDSKFYEDFYFKWEEDFYNPRKYANQNFKYRIHC